MISSSCDLCCWQWTNLQWDGTKFKSRTHKITPREEVAGALIWSIQLSNWRRLRLRQRQKVQIWSLLLLLREPPNEDHDFILHTHTHTHRPIELVEWTSLCRIEAAAAMSMGNHALPVGRLSAVFIIIRNYIESESAARSEMNHPSSAGRLHCAR